MNDRRFEAAAAHLQLLLPMREKVSAKLTDER
jgi:hypothetical protein